MRIEKRFIATLVIGCLPMMVLAHHSNAEWDDSVKQEVVGEIVNVVWNNPHVHWSMMVRNDLGEQEIWNMAGSALNHLSRQGVPNDPFKTGDIVRVWGSPSTRRPRNVNADSVLLRDGREIMVRKAEAHWPNAQQVGEVAGESGYSDAAVTGAQPSGFFNVWEMDRATASTIRDTRDRGELSLTPEAEKVMASWDDWDNWVVRCEPRGMPSTMFNSYPREFVQDGDRIFLRIEEHDNTRVIHMSDELNAETQPTTPLGFSVGHWQDENTLVVNTSRISFPWASTFGVPQSEEVTMLERFTLSEDELRLSYELTSTDPATFNEPHTSRVEWVAVGGMEIQPFNMNCSDNPWVAVD